MIASRLAGEVAGRLELTGLGVDELEFGAFVAEGVFRRIWCIEGASGMMLITFMVHLGCVYGVFRVCLVGAFWSRWVHLRCI